MTRAELKRASEALESAAGDTTDDAASERVSELASQLSNLSSADRGPDHGRLARIEAALDEVQTSVGDEIATDIENALDEIRTYRETLEGV
jgi:lipase chaperone LimK